MVEEVQTELAELDGLIVHHKKVLAKASSQELKARAEALKETLESQVIPTLKNADTLVQKRNKFADLVV